MEAKAKRARPRDMPRHHTPECLDSGWEDKKETGSRIRHSTTGIQKRKNDNVWNVCAETRGLTCKVSL